MPHDPSAAPPSLKNDLSKLADGPPAPVRRDMDARVHAAMVAEAERRRMVRRPRRGMRAHRTSVGLTATLAVATCALALVLLALITRPPTVVGPGGSASVSPASALALACGPSEPFEGLPSGPQVRSGRTPGPDGGDGRIITIPDLRKAGFLMPLPAAAYGLDHYRATRDGSHAYVVMDTETVGDRDPHRDVLPGGGVTIDESRDAGSMVQVGRRGASGVAYDIELGPYAGLLTQNAQSAGGRRLWTVWFDAEGHGFAVVSGLDTGAAAVDLVRSMVCRSGLLPARP